MTTTEPNKKPHQKLTYVAGDLPAEGFARLPAVAKAFGVSKNTYLERAKAGIYPAGKLLSPRSAVCIPLLRSGKP